MQELTWTDIEKQSIPKWLDNRSRMSGRSFVKSFLVINRDHGPIVHACWFLPYERGSTDHKIRSYPHNRPFDMKITHWCLPPYHVQEWMDVEMFWWRQPQDLDSECLVIDDAGVIEHMYLNKNHDLRLKKSRGKLKSTPVGWLNVPEFKD